MFTEQIFPAMGETADALTAAIVATATFSLLAGFVGIPVALLSSIVVSVLNWAVDGSITAWTNWFLAHKDEIVCVIYSALPSIPDAASGIRAYIDADGDLSLLEKQLTKSVLGSEWHMTWVMQDQEENGTWDDYFVVGQCNECEPVPEGCYGFGACDLGDWNGGTVACGIEAAEIRGGTATWLPETMVIPNNSYLVVRWVPRSDGYPEARAIFGVRRVSDSAGFGIITTPDSPVNVPRTDYAAISGALWGQEVRFIGQQVAYWAQPVYWCITTTPPE